MKDNKTNIIGHDEIVRGELLIPLLKDSKISQVAIDKMIGRYCIDYNNTIKKITSFNGLLDEEGNAPIIVFIGKEVKFLVCATEKHARDILNLSNQDNNPLTVSDSLH